MKKNTTAKKSPKALPQGKKNQIREVAAKQRLTVGLDLGDRTSRYCVLDEAGEVVSEGQLLTTKVGLSSDRVRYSERCRPAEWRWKWERIRHG